MGQHQHYDLIVRINHHININLPNIGINSTRNINIIKSTSTSNLKDLEQPELNASLSIDNTNRNKAEKPINCGSYTGKKVRADCIFKMP